MNEYPVFIKDDISNHSYVLRQIVSKRRDDVIEFNNLNKSLMIGRKVNKVPSSSSDVDSKDRAGDFNYSSSYLYLCVDTGGGVEWRRIALGTW